MPLSSGTRLGPYEILAKLGAGGMGEVYRALDSRMGREVAIKVSAQKFSERFEREVRLIASLNHPNICTLFDVGPDYLVMELIEGPTLAERIRESAIPFEESLAIARQVADALEYAHSLGEVVTAAIGAGLRIDGLREHMDTVREHRGGVLPQEADGRYRLRVDGEVLPVLYTLLASR